MEVRKYYYVGGLKHYNLTLEEHIANIFRILNSGDNQVDTISYDFFYNYAQFINEEFKKRGIHLHTAIGFWGYNDLFNHGIFGPYIEGEDIHTYRGFGIVKDISQEEYIKMYMNHPAECVEILTSEKVADYIISHNTVDRKPKNVRVVVRSSSNS